MLIIKRSNCAGQFHPAYNGTTSNLPTAVIGATCTRGPGIASSHVVKAIAHPKYSGTFVALELLRINSNMILANVLPPAPYEMLSYIWPHTHCKFSESPSRYGHLELYVGSSLFACTEKVPR